MKPDNVYQLYVKTDGVWHWLGNVYAPTYDAAQRQAIASLATEHYDKPIRLEYDQDAPTNVHAATKKGVAPSKILHTSWNSETKRAPSSP